MARLARTAAASPSMANGTPASEHDPAWDDPATNVIIGCTDATCAPHLRNTANSSLGSAPLECKTTPPFQSPFCANESPTLAIASSGTQNQTTSAAIFTCAMAT